jgi:hypothetical protein
VAWAVVERRGAGARAVLGLPAPRRAARVALPGALALTIALLALAATQPVVASNEQTDAGRTADVFVVLDTSRSMLAAHAAGTPTRFDRARDVARRIAASDPSLAVGLASFTDRVLPHLFPTTERGDFYATLDDAMGVDRPPPALRASPGRLTRASNLAVLADLATAGFFASSPTRRIVVVVTDGESRPFDPEQMARAFRHARIAPVFVQVWAPDEHVWTPDGGAEPDYAPDPGAGVQLARLAVDVGGRAFSETQVDDAIAAVRADARGNRLETHRQTTSVRRLAPALAAGALLPLAFVLWRRNLV